MGDLIRSGKIHYFGVSNVTGWQLQKIVDTAARMGLPPIVSLQVGSLRRGGKGVGGTTPSNRVWPLFMGRG